MALIAARASERAVLKKNNGVLSNPSLSNLAARMFGGNDLTGAHSVSECLRCRIDFHRKRASCSFSDVRSGKGALGRKLNPRYRHRVFLLLLFVFMVFVYVFTHMRNDYT